MNRQELTEIVRTYFGKVLNVNGRYARIMLKNASPNLQQAVFKVDFGGRSFVVDIHRHANRIKLVEIITHKKWGFDRRNPLAGYTRIVERGERVIHSDRLDKYEHSPM